MIRKAKVQDAKRIRKLINFYAEKNEMLPRSLNEIYDHIRDFFVYEEKGKIYGCSALHVTWEELGEVRSLAVAKSKQRHGIGTRLVGACLDEARRLGISRIFALTYKPDYFKKFGFKGIDKYELPHKIWSDCVKCIHFPDCKESALVRDINVRR